MFHTVAFFLSAHTYGITSRLGLEGRDAQPYTNSQTQGAASDFSLYVWQTSVPSQPLSPESPLHSAHYKPLAVGPLATMKNHLPLRDKA